MNTRCCCLQGRTAVGARHWRGSCPSTSTATSDMAAQVCDRHLLPPADAARPAPPRPAAGWLADCGCGGVRRAQAAGWAGAPPRSRSGMPSATTQRCASERADDPHPPPPCTCTILGGAAGGGALASHDALPSRARVRACCAAHVPLPPVGCAALRGAVQLDRMTCGPREQLELDCALAAPPPPPHACMHARAATTDRQRHHRGHGRHGTGGRALPSRPWRR
jgi:hypothetical protein